VWKGRERSAKRLVSRLVHDPAVPLLHAHTHLVRPSRGGGRAGRGGIPEGASSNHRSSGGWCARCAGQARCTDRDCPSNGRARRRRASPCGTSSLGSTGNPGLDDQLRPGGGVPRVAWRPWSLPLLRCVEWDDRLENPGSECGVDRRRRLPPRCGPLSLFGALPFTGSTDGPTPGRRSSRRVPSAPCPGTSHAGGGRNGRPCRLFDRARWPARWPVNDPS
jgi:hypothetical protein